MISLQLQTGYVIARSSRDVNRPPTELQLGAVGIADLDLQRCGAVQAQRFPGMNQASFQKRQREKARQERAEAKASRREERRSQTAAPNEAVDADVHAALVRELADLHRRYESGTIELDDFLAAKDALTARLAAS